MKHMSKLRYKMELLAFIKGLPLIKADNSKWPDALRNLRQEIAEMTEDCDWLEERAALKDTIDRIQEDGKIAFIEDSTDCDHARSVTTCLIPANVMSFVARRRWVYEDTEGPTYVAMVAPSEREQDWHHDYALGAFEEGHPHIIYR